MPNPTGNVVREIALPRTFFAIIATNATSGIIPFTVNATVNAIGGNPPYQFTWDFGDNTQQATGNIVSHTYSNPGTYVLKVTALDTYGNEATSAIYLTANAIITTLSISGISIAESNSNFVKDGQIVMAQQPAPSNIATESIKISKEKIVPAQQSPQYTNEGIKISSESITFKNS
jgi:PKD repeat protein